MLWWKMLGWKMLLWALMSSDKTLVKVKYPYQITLCESFRCLRGRECLFLTITPCQLELLEPAVSFSCMELVPHKLKDFAHCIELLHLQDFAVFDSILRSRSIQYCKSLTCASRLSYFFKQRCISMFSNSKTSRRRTRSSRGSEAGLGSDIQWQIETFAF